MLALRLLPPGLSGRRHCDSFPPSDDGERGSGAVLKKETEDSRQKTVVRRQNNKQEKQPRKHDDLFLFMLSYRTKLAAGKLRFFLVGS
jgi:hypothetical protein